MFPPMLIEKCRRCGSAQFLEKDHFGSRVVCISGHDDMVRHSIRREVADQETTPIPGHTGEGRPSHGTGSLPADYAKKSSNYAKKKTGYRKNNGFDDYGGKAL